MFAMSEYARRVYRLIFTAAAAYNIAFGLWAALFPRAFFTTFDLEPVSYPAIWACLGMVVGLYGVGYGYAAWRLDRAFPFIAIGLAAVDDRRDFTDSVLCVVGQPCSDAARADRVCHRRPRSRVRLQRRVDAH